MLYIDLKKWRSELTGKKTQAKEKSRHETGGFIEKRKRSFLRILRMIKKEFKLLWTDKFNIFLALILPPFIILLMAWTATTHGEPSAVECVVVSYDSNTFINPNNYTESKMDNYSTPYIQAVNKSELLDPILPSPPPNKTGYIPFFNASEDIYAMEKARTYLLDEIM